MRAIAIACLAALFSACGSQNSQGPKPVPWTGDSGLAPPSLTQPDSAPAAPSSAPGAASKSEAAPAPSAAAAAALAPVVAPTQDIPPAKPEELGEMSSSTREATTITRPCELSSCGVVLSISGDKRWEIEVQMHDGTVQVFQQDYRPLFQIGDTVLVDGNAVFLWN